MFFVMTVYSTFGRGANGVSIFVLYLLLWVVLFSFILSHWEKYNTGILFLPWGYDLSLVVSAAKTKKAKGPPLQGFCRAWFLSPARTLERLRGCPVKLLRSRFRTGKRNMPS